MAATNQPTCPMLVNAQPRGSNQATSKSKSNNLPENLEEALRSKEFLQKSDEEKFGKIGAILNSIQTHRKTTDRNISDISHNYSKYCLIMKGSAIPPHNKDEDAVDIWRNCCSRKYGIVITEAEKQQFRTCHRTENGNLVACFITTIKNSVFDRCTYRGARDGQPSNWNGQLAPPPPLGQQGGPTMDLTIERMASQVDQEIKSIGLFLKKQDKNLPRELKRVEQVKVSPGGFVIFRDGKGSSKRMYHAWDAMALMREDEKNQFGNTKKGPHVGKRDRGKKRALEDAVGSANGAAKMQHISNDKP